MNIRKGILLAFAAFTICISALYAQNNANLKSGVYRFSGIQGSGMVIIQGSNISQTVKNIIIRATDGSVYARGTAKINGNRVSIDYGDKGYETWTIVDNETFTDDQAGLTWRWVRNYKNDEL